MLARAKCQPAQTDGVKSRAERLTFVDVMRAGRATRGAQSLFGDRRLARQRQRCCQGGRVESCQGGLLLQVLGDSVGCCQAVGVTEESQRRINSFRWFLKTQTASFFYRSACVF